MAANLTQAKKDMKLNQAAYWENIFKMGGVPSNNRDIANESCGIFRNMKYNSKSKSKNKKNKKRNKNEKQKRLKIVKKKGYSFGFIIQTDGISCSYVFKKEETPGRYQFNSACRR